MSATAPHPAQQPPAPDIGGDNAYRERLDGGGRVHIDRPLPFLVLCRHEDSPFSLARRIASISAASVIWPTAGGKEADASAQSMTASLMAELADDYPRFLLVSLRDLPRDASVHAESPQLEPFAFRIGASSDPAAQAAADCLKAALGDIEIDLRTAKPCMAQCVPAADWIEALAANTDISQLTLGIPQVHRIPGGENRQIYPLIYHELESAIFDAVLQAIAVFVEHSTPDGDGDGVPGGRPHHRSLGRSRYVEAATKADDALSRISRSFDFLLGVSPINSVEAYQRFEEKGRKETPHFRYRPLPINPDATKRRLYRINLRAVEDPVLEKLFREKQLELDQQLMMLQRRNTPQFKYVSLLQYGGVEAELLAQARAILDNVKASPGGGDCRFDARQMQEAADKVLGQYRAKAPAFAAAQACLREDTGPGLMVSGESLLISTATSVPKARVDPLLQHEIGVHVLTFINGSQQGLGIFGAGLADYEGIQEGLGVFAEFIVGGLTPARLRLLAARVLVVDAMLGGADFIECHHLLHRDHGFSSQGAFNIVARIFRSGGLTKDAIYLRGFQQVVRRVSDGLPLDPFWYGKIAEHHVPIVEELRTRGMLGKPVATPEFLDRPDAQARITRLREGSHFLDLLGAPAP